MDRWQVCNEQWQQTTVLVALKCMSTHFLQNSQATADMHVQQMPAGVSQKYLQSS